MLAICCLTITDWVSVASWLTAMVQHSTLRVWSWCNSNTESPQRLWLERIIYRKCCLHHVCTMQQERKLTTCVFYNHECPAGHPQPYKIHVQCMQPWLCDYCWIMVTSKAEWLLQHHVHIAPLPPPGEAGTSVIAACCQPSSIEVYLGLSNGVRLDQGT